MTLLVLKLHPRDIRYDIVNTIKMLIDMTYLYKVYNGRMLLEYKLKNTKYFPLSNPITDDVISIVIDVIGKYKILNVGDNFIGKIDMDGDKVMVKSVNILCSIKNVGKFVIDSKVLVKITALIKTTSWDDIFLCDGIILLHEFR
jgi:hypothetical protein